MNPLIEELLRGYRSSGVPRLEVQARDLVRLMVARERESLAAAARAVNGYRAAQPAAPVRSIWDRRLLGLRRA